MCDISPLHGEAGEDIDFTQRTRNTFIVNLDGNDDDSETAGVRVSSQEVSDVSAHFQQLSF